MDAVEDNSMFLATIIIGAAILLFFLYLVWSKGSSKSGNSIILMGTSESGKTNLLYSLIFEKEEHEEGIKTVTSMVENIEEYVTSNRRAINLVDVPGNARLRQGIFSKHKDNACAVAFVVDSTTVLNNIRDVTEILYTVLMDEVIQRKGCPIAVVCNKVDLDSSKDTGLIKTALEGEIETLRKTSGSSLGGLEGESQKPKRQLGQPGVKFSLEHAANPITFLCSSTVAEEGLDALENWIDDL